MTAAANTRHGAPMHVGDEVVAYLDRLRNYPPPAVAEQLADARARQGDEQMQRQREVAEAVLRSTRIRTVRLRRAGIPVPYIRVLLGLPDEDGAVETYDPERYMARVVARWRATKHRTLVLGGSVGIGKSLSACWLVDQGPRRKYMNDSGGYDANWPDELAPRYVHAGRLARLSTYGRGGAPPELELIERCALLVIDEVGGADVGGTAGWVARLDSIVATRSDQGLDTIVTTNLRIEDEQINGQMVRGFRTMYGERVLDRMRGDGSCWVERKENSMRTSARWEAPT